MTGLGRLAFTIALLGAATPLAAQTAATTGARPGAARALASTPPAGEGGLTQAQRAGRRQSEIAEATFKKRDEAMRKATRGICSGC